MIDAMQFGLMPGKRMTDAIFIVQQMQEKYGCKRKLYFAFVDLEKAFDREPMTLYCCSISNYGSGVDLS